MSASKPSFHAAWISFLGFLHQQLWLAPGLIAAAILLILLLLGTNGQHPPEKPIKRLIHAPNLNRFQGIAPRHHQDLEA